MEKLPPIAELVKRKGDAANGQAVLAKSVTSEVQCLKCHTVRGLGGQIGPDLSMIGKKGSRENLFESLLQPAKAVADQYVNWKLDTKDGQSLNGLIVGETPQAVTLRDANGKDYTVPVGDIDKRAKLTTSLMPDNLAQTLTEDELVDVVEYLATLQTPSLTPESWHVVGPFRSPGGNEGLGHDYGPESKPFDAKAMFLEWNGPSSGPKPKDVGWRVVRPAASGYVDLAALHGAAANNSVSYAYLELESPEDQEATLLIGTDDGGKLWVNGKEVFNEKVTRAAAPDQNRVTVKLKKGKNEVLLKVANGNNPHGFYLTILSAQELKAK
jgi:putative heme-binding domain-containing protein